MRIDTLSADVALTFRLDELVIDCCDPATLATFWGQVLGYEMADSHPDAAELEDPSGLRPSICFQRVADEKLAKNRLHFDLDVGEGMLELAIERLVALGAHPVNVGQPANGSWAVMADPEGNEFCVVA